MSQYLRKYGTQMTKNCQSTYVQKPMPAKIQAIFMISTTDALYGSYAFQHNSALHHAEMHILWSQKAKGLRTGDCTPPLHDGQKSEGLHSLDVVGVM
jgi:hypothetical protein